MSETTKVKKGATHGGPGFRGRSQTFAILDHNFFEQAELFWK